LGLFFLFLAKTGQIDLTKVCLCVIFEYWFFKI